MTTIGAIRAEESAGGKQEDHFVFFADSMGTYDGGQDHRSTKEDSYQKLFTVDRCLIAMTGRADIGSWAVEAVRSQPHADAYDVARHLRDYVRGLDNGSITRFLIAGPGRGKLQLFHVGAFPKDENDHADPVIQEKGYAFDGSGGKYAERRFDSYLERQHISKGELADILSFAHELGVRGAQDIGANDKMQYGIVSADGISLLYHPDINIDMSEYEKYITLMTGISLQLPQAQRPEEYPTACQRRVETWDDLESITKTLGSFFHMFSSDLGAYTANRESYMKWANMLMHEDYARDVFEATLADCRKSRANLEKGVRALMIKGISAIVEYERDFDRRREEFRQHALELYEIQRATTGTSTLI